MVGQFTPWISWEKRTGVEESGAKLTAYGGVYLIAHFLKSPPTGTADHLDDRVVYVGEGKNLGRRWYQFERSAKHELPGHSGGWSHLEWRTKSGTSWESLHVAALPIWFAGEGDTDASGSLARRFRMYVEQTVLWQIVTHRTANAPRLSLLNVK